MSDVCHESIPDQCLWPHFYFVVTWLAQPRLPVWLYHRLYRWRTELQCVKMAPFPDEVDVFTGPHWRMKQLVGLYCEKVSVMKCRLLILSLTKECTTVWGQRTSGRQLTQQLACCLSSQGWVSRGSWTVGWLSHDYTRMLAPWSGLWTWTWRYMWIFTLPAVWTNLLGCS